MQPKIIGSIQCHKTVKNASKQPSREMSEKKNSYSQLYMMCMHMFHKGSMTWINKIVYKTRDVYKLASSFS